MTSAFAAPTALTARAPAAIRPHTRMCARTPGDASASPSKYSQYINASRLNKAPLISVNNYPNKDYNYVSVSLATLPTDIGAATTLLAGVAGAETYAPSAGPDVWGAYYDAATINTAPFISIAGSDKDASKCAVAVAMYEVPLQKNVPKAILEASGDADPDAGRAVMYRRPAKVPVIKAVDGGDDYKSQVSIEFPIAYPNLAAAEAILNQYRK